MFLCHNHRVKTQNLRPNVEKRTISTSFKHVRSTWSPLYLASQVGLQLVQWFWLSNPSSRSARKVWFKTRGLTILEFPWYTARNFGPTLVSVIWIIFTPLIRLFNRNLTLLLGKMCRITSRRWTSYDVDLCAFYLWKVQFLKNHTILLTLLNSLM